MVGQGDSFARFMRIGARVISAFPHLARRWAPFLASTLLVLTAFCLLTLAHADPTFPKLTGRVVDDAEILSDATKSQLTAALAAEEKKSGTQIVVVTIKSLEGTPIETYGYQLGRHWGIGQKGKNNGALFIVAPTEHRMRIEVGYGLEEKLTDLQSAVIIHDIVTPKFKAGDFDQGVIDGTNAILKVIGGGSVAGVPPSDFQSDVQDAATFSVGTFILIACMIVGFCWPVLLIFYLVRNAKWLHGAHGKSSGGSSSSSHDSSDSDSSSSSSSDDDDDFSGGGGDFGGGGASGSW
jgi:uncharacterized protein